MRLIEIIGNEGILPRLASSRRDEALMEMVENLVSTGRIEADQREDVLMALLKREALGATNIAPKVAIPHVKTELVNSFVGVLGVSEEGIDFGDGSRVNVIFLFLSPARAVSGHLRLLAHIGGILNHSTYVKQLCQATGPLDLLEVVKDAERAIFGEEREGDAEQGGTPVLA